MWRLAASLGGALEKTQQLNNISTGVEANKMCLGGDEGGYQTDEAAFNFL